jgi:hypothetical protein
MPTLVLPPQYSEDSVRIAQAATRAGWNAVRLTSWDLPEGTAYPEPVLYGEIGFAQAIASKLRVRLMEPAPDLLHRLPKKFVRRGIELSSLGEARKRKGRWLIRPLDRKLFPKRVHHDGNTLPSSRSLPDSTPLLMAEVVEFDWEYRFFIFDGSIGSYSPVRRGSFGAREGDRWLFEEPRDSEAQACVSDLLLEASRLLPAAMVVDLGYREGQWSVVDVVCPAEAALYGCSEDKVLPVIRRSSGM